MTSTPDVSSEEPPVRDALVPAGRSELLHFKATPSTRRCLLVSPSRTALCRAAGQCPVDAGLRVPGGTSGPGCAGSGATSCCHPQTRFRFQIRGAWTAGCPLWVLPSDHSVVHSKPASRCKPLFASIAQAARVSGGFRAMLCDTPCAHPSSPLLVGVWDISRF